MQIGCWRGQVAAVGRVAGVVGLIIWTSTYEAAASETKKVDQQAQLCMGVYKEKTKDPDRMAQGFAACDMWVTTSNASARALYGRALVRGRLGQSPEDFRVAYQDLSQVIQRSPEWPNAWSVRALINVKLDNYDQALRDVNKAITLKQAADAPPDLNKEYWKRAGILFVLGAEHHSIEILEKALDDAKTLKSLGVEDERLPRFVVEVQANIDRLR